jgi:hypothetical protein
MNNGTKVRLFMLLYLKMALIFQELKINAILTTINA